MNESREIYCHCCLWSVSSEDKLLSHYENDLTVRSYKDKRSTVSDTPLTFHRINALREKGCMIQPSSKKSDKLKSNLPELETLIRNHNVISFQWRTRLYLIVVVANKVFVHIYVNSETGDLEFLYIDTSLQKKFTIENDLSSAIIAGQFYAVTFRESNKLAIVSFNKVLPIYFSGSKVSKLSNFDPKVTLYDLPILNMGGVERFNWSLFSNDDHNLLVAFAKRTVNFIRDPQNSFLEGAQIGARSDNDLAVFQLSPTGVAQEVGRFLLESDILDLVFTETGFLTAEKPLSFVNVYTCILCSFLVFDLNPRRVEVAKITLKSEVKCCKWSPDQRYCVVASTHKHMEIWDNLSMEKISVSAKIAPSFVSWHSSSLVFFLFSSTGDIQIYDIGANMFTVGLCNENPQCFDVFSVQSFLKSSVAVVNVGSCHKVELSLVEASSRAVQPHTKILVLLRSGPFMMMDFITPKFTTETLLKMSLKSNDITFKSSFNLMQRLNWNFDSDLLLYASSNILDSLLSKPITFQAEDVIDRVLAFFNESASKGLIDEPLVEQLENVFHLYSLKYIQMLTRTGKLEKALDVSINISCPDSCMDVYHMASDLGEYELAKVGRYHSEEILQRESYSEHLSCLFPKIEERENSSDEDEENNTSLREVVLPIVMLDELEHGRGVKIPSCIEEGFKNMYIVNKPLIEDNEDCTDAEALNTVDEGRSSQENQTQIRSSESVYQFGSVLM